MIKKITDIIEQKTRKMKPVFSFEVFPTKTAEGTKRLFDTIETLAGNSITVDDEDPGFSIGDPAPVTVIIGWEASWVLVGWVGEEAGVRDACRAKSWLSHRAS